MRLVFERQEVAGKLLLKEPPELGAQLLKGTAIDFSLPCFQMELSVFQLNVMCC